MRFAMFVVLLTVLITCSVWADNDSYVLTNPAPTLKVQPTCTEAGPVTSSLRLAMARGEYEPVQLVVSAKSSDLKSVRVAVNKLQGPNGAVIPADRVVVTPLGFVDCKKPSPGAPLQGEIPDVLLPNRPMNISAGRRQPFYITVHTTADDVPGSITGWSGFSLKTLLPHSCLLPCAYIRLPFR